MAIYGQNAEESRAGAKRIARPAAAKDRLSFETATELGTAGYAEPGGNPAKAAIGAKQTGADQNRS